MTVVIDEKCINAAPMDHFPGATPFRAAWIRFEDKPNELPTTRDAVASLQNLFVDFLRAAKSAPNNYVSFIDDLATIIINPQDRNISLESKSVIGDWVCSVTRDRAGVNMLPQAGDIIEYFQQLIRSVNSPVRAYAFSDCSNCVGFWTIHENKNVEVMYQLAEIHGLLIDKFPFEEISFLMISEDEFEEMQLPTNAKQVFDGGGYNANR